MMRYHFIPIRVVTVKKKKYVKDKAQLDFLYIVGVNTKWYNHSRKHLGVSSEVKHTYPYDPAISILGVNFRKVELSFPQKPIHKCS